MARCIEGSEPRAAEDCDGGRKLREIIDEMQLLCEFLKHRLTEEEVTDLMLRIAQCERHGLQVIRGLQAANQDFEKLRQSASAQQLELPLLRLLQDHIIACNFRLQVR